MWQLPPNQTCPLTAFPRLMKHEAAVYTSLTHTRTQLQNEPLLPHLCHMTVTWMLCGGSGGCVQQTRCYVWLGSFHLTAPAQETRSSCTTADAHRDPTTPITNSPPPHVLLLSRAKEGEGPHPLYDSFSLHRQPHNGTPPSHYCTAHAHNGEDISRHGKYRK